MYQIPGWTSLHRTVLLLSVLLLSSMQVRLGQIKHFWFISQFAGK